MMIACGIVFELPIVIVVLSWIGIIHSSYMRKYRRYAIVILLAVAAIITPTTDAFTMITVALPLIVLYEISIILAMIIEKRKSSR
jgi:sec-independent protein translocase protein TatC